MKKKPPADQPTIDFAGSGIAGLDHVMSGGFTPTQLYLIEGVPGSGKTTLAMQFMMEGMRQKEPVLYITLSETRSELLASGASHGWDLSELPIYELVPSEDSLLPEEQYTMFHPSEVELSETTKAILSEVERVRPRRVVFDSLSEMRMISGGQLRFRRQVLALKLFFASRGCTVMLLDDQSDSDPDMQLRSLAHGVISLENVHPEYGKERRRLRVLKFRGRGYRSGYHDYLIKTGGLEVFPRLTAADHRQERKRAILPTGIAELDRLLGGGIDEASSTLLVGAPGTGKSTLASQCVANVAEQGLSAAMFIFDESIHTLLNRTDGLGIKLRKHVESGRVTISPVDPAELSPGEFTHLIRTQVEDRDVRVVVIDSMNGYLTAMPGENFLTMHLHEFLAYLSQRGVATIMVNAQQGLIGSQMTSTIDASYLADTIILLRYFELKGEIRQALSVVKKRGGVHERTIREFSLENGHIRVGEPLRHFRGVLTGVPVYEGNNTSLMNKGSE